VLAVVGVGGIGEEGQQLVDDDGEDFLRGVLGAYGVVVVVVVVGAP
jgi:FMN-dependent NADH-azoreductase